MRLDAVIHESLEGFTRSISCVGGEALRAQIKAILHTFDHGHRHPVLFDPVAPRTLGINDDTNLVVD